jgi:hypothetical protein
MIGYVQEGNAKFWDQRIAGWINGIAGNMPGWTANDLLRLQHSYDARGIAVFSSIHSRSGDLSDIELRHLWVGMQ